MLNPIGKARPETVSEAMRTPIAEGPVVFIGAPFLLWDEESRRVGAYHLGPVPQ